MNLVMGGTVWEPLNVVGKSVLADAVEGDAFQKPRGDDAVRIDVIPPQRNAGTGDDGDCFACHFNSPNDCARR